MLKGQLLIFLVNFTTIKWKSDDMIEELMELRQNTHMALTSHIVSFLPAIEETYKYIAKNVDEDDVVTFKFPMKVKNMTEGFTGNIYIDGMGNLELDNECYFFHVEMEDGIVQRITVDDDLIFRMNGEYISNLDMEHWESLYDLYYLIEAFNEQFDVGIKL